jgi:hypothetical protein
LSNIFHFLQLPDALRSRTVSKKFDEACFIGLKICVIDMQENIDQFVFVIGKNFTQEAIHKHQTLKDESMMVNALLKKHLKSAVVKRSELFSTYKQIAYLNRPNHLIIKPIFAVMVLIRTFPKIASDFDWHDYSQMHAVWAKVKNQLRKSDFLNQLENFDVRSVT